MTGEQFTTRRICALLSHTDTAADIPLTFLENQSSSRRMYNSLTPAGIQNMQRPAALPSRLCCPPICGRCTYAPRCGSAGCERRSNRPGDSIRHRAIVAAIQEHPPRPHLRVSVGSGLSARQLNCRCLAGCLVLDLRPRSMSDSISMSVLGLKSGQDSHHGLVISRRCRILGLQGLHCP